MRCALVPGQIIIFLDVMQAFDPEIRLQLSLMQLRNQIFFASTDRCFFMLPPRLSPYSFRK